MADSATTQALSDVWGAFTNPFTRLLGKAIDPATYPDPASWDEGMIGIQPKGSLTNLYHGTQYPEDITPGSSPKMTYDHYGERYIDTPAKFTFASPNYNVATSLAGDFGDTVLRGQADTASFNKGIYTYPYKPNQTIISEPQVLLKSEDAYDVFKGGKVGSVVPRYDFGPFSGIVSPDEMMTNIPRQSVKYLGDDVPFYDTRKNLEKAILPLKKGASIAAKFANRLNPLAAIGATVDNVRRENYLGAGGSALSILPGLPGLAGAGLDIASNIDYIRDAGAADTAMPGSTYVADPNYDAQAIQSEVNANRMADTTQALSRYFGNVGSAAENALGRGLSSLVSPASADQDYTNNSYMDKNSELRQFIDKWSNPVGLVVRGVQKVYNAFDAPVPQLAARPIPGWDIPEYMTDQELYEGRYPMDAGAIHDILMRRDYSPEYVQEMEDAQKRRDNTRGFRGNLPNEEYVNPVIVDPLIQEAYPRFTAPQAAGPESLDLINRISPPEGSVAPYQGPVEWDLPPPNREDWYPTVTDRSEASLYPIGTTTGSLLGEPSNLVNINTILQNSLVGPSGPEDMSTDWRSKLGINPDPGYNMEQVLGMLPGGSSFNKDPGGQRLSMARFIKPEPSIENLNTLLLNTLVPQEGITEVVSRPTSQPGPGGPAKPQPEQDDSSNARQAREAEEKARADREKEKEKTETKPPKSTKSTKPKDDKKKKKKKKKLDPVVSAIQEEIFQQRNTDLLDFLTQGYSRDKKAVLPPSHMLYDI